MKVVQIISLITLKNFITITAHKEKRRPARLDEVLLSLIELDVKIADNADLRYSGIHIIPCGTEQKPERLALVYYDDSPAGKESSSYIISFVEGVNAIKDKSLRNVHHYFWYFDDNQY